MLRLLLMSIIAIGSMAQAVPGVVINGGSPYTRVAAVTLSISGADGYAEMCVSNSATCKAYEPIAVTKSWALKGSGNKTVTVRFRGVAGEASSSDAIVMDNKAPVSGRLSVVYGNTQNILSWTGFADALSGIASYVLVGAAGSSAPPCTAAALYSGSATSYTHAGLTNGQVYSYRICASDGAGNSTAGAKKTEFISAIPRPESDPPTGTVTINGCAAATSSPNVTLAINAVDASTVTQMCISEKATCKAWVPFASTRSFSLSKAAGIKTVRVWLRDQYNNATTTPAATDTIVLDNKPPVGGTVSAIACETGVSLAWNGFSDPQTGVAAYKVVVVPGKKVPACTGPSSYTGTATGRTITGLTNGVRHGYAVCATDAMGNVMKKGRGGVVVPTAGVSCATNPGEQGAGGVGAGEATCAGPSDGGSSNGDGSGGQTGGGQTGGGDTGDGGGTTPALPSGLDCTWTTVASYELNTIPANVETKNGCYLDQRLETVGGRTSFIQRSDWNMFYLPPVFDSSFDGAAVEADLFIPAVAAHRGAGLSLMVDPARPGWSCFDNDIIHGLEAGIGCDNASADLKVGVGQRASTSSRTVCCSTGTPARELITNKSTGISCSAVTNRWVRMRLEASRRLGKGRLWLDGALIASFDTDFDNTGTRVKLGSGAPSYTSSGVAFSKVKLLRGVCR